MWMQFFKVPWIRHEYYPFHPTPEKNNEMHRQLAGGNKRCMRN